MSCTHVASGLERRTVGRIRMVMGSWHVVVRLAASTTTGAAWLDTTMCAALVGVSWCKLV